MNDVSLQQGDIPNGVLSFSGSVDETTNALREASGKK